MLGYRVQNTNWFIGSSSAGSTLTASYVDNVANVPTGGMSAIDIYVTYTPAEDAAILYWQIETGPSKDDVFKWTSSEIVSDLDTRKLLPGKFNETVVHAITYKFTLSYNIACKSFRISFKETATSYGTIGVQATVSGI